MKYLITKSSFNPTAQVGMTITITAEEAASKITAFAEAGYIDHKVVNDYKTIQAIWNGLTNLRALYFDTSFQGNDKEKAKAMVASFQAEVKNYLGIFKALVVSIKGTGNQGASILEDAYRLTKTLFEGEVLRLRASVAATFSDG